MHRRQFLDRSLGAVAAGLAPAAGPLSSRAQPARAAEPIVDAHAYLGHWPLQRLSCATGAELADALRARGVAQAWVGSFDGLLHKDVAAVNQRLADDCRRAADKLLTPLGTINPTLPDWQEDLRRCHQVHRMPGVRLHPRYHAYGLDDGQFIEVLKSATRRGMFVQVVVDLEGAPPSGLMAPQYAVDASALEVSARSIDGLRLVIAGAARSGGVGRSSGLANSPHVWFEAADCEPGDAALGEFADRLLFGSGFPLASFDAATAQLRESPLSPAQRQAVWGANAQKLTALGRQLGD